MLNFKAMTPLERDGKRPRQGTKLALVLDLLHKGKSRSEIAEDIGIGRTQLAFVIRNLRSGGYYDQRYPNGYSPRDEEVRLAISAGHGGILPEVLHHFRKGASVDEAAEFIQKDRYKVRRTQRAARVGGLLPKPTSEQRREALSKSHRGKPALSHGREYSPRQKRRFALARKVEELGFTARESTRIDNLNQNFKSAGISFPDFYPDKLILEAFSYAVEMNQVTPTNNKLKELIETTLELDTDVFTDLRQELRFVNSNKTPPKKIETIAKMEEGRRIPEVNTARWIEVVEWGNIGIIVDNSAEREASRTRVAAGKLTVIYQQSRL